MRSLLRYSLVAAAIGALVLLSIATLTRQIEQKVQAQSPANTVKTKLLVISAFRENGPNGTGDEFVELFNPKTTAVLGSDLSGDPNGTGTGIGVFSSAGNGTTSNAVSLRCHVPGIASIPARGWYLCGGSQYSLSNLGANGATAHSVPDRTIGTGNAVAGDIPNDAGLALLNIGTNIITACPIGSFNCPSGFNFSAPAGSGNATVYDKVGFRPYGPGAPATGYPSLAPQYCEGTCLQPVGDASTITLTPGGSVCPAAVGPASDPAAFPVQASVFIAGVPVCYGESGQYKIDRRRSAQQFDASAGNLHRDTDNNADDFILDAPNPGTGNVGQSITGTPGVSSVLGAAGPHNRFAPPITGSGLHTEGGFDGANPLGPRNAERRYNQDPAIANAQNDPLGTFILRRRFTGTATGARYRVDDLTTLCGGQAGTNGITSVVATQEARNLRGPDFTVPPSTSPTPTCQGEGGDAGLFTAILKAVNHPQETVVDSSNSTRTVFGTVLEDTSAGAAGTPAVGRHQPIGGGSNSSYVATSATVVTGDGVNGGTGSFALATGAPTRIAFKFGVVRSGRFKLLLGPEAVVAGTPGP